MPVSGLAQDARSNVVDCLHLSALRESDKTPVEMFDPESAEAEGGHRGVRRLSHEEEDDEHFEDGDVFLPIPSCTARGGSHDTDKSQAHTPEPLAVEELFLLHQRESPIERASSEPSFGLEASSPSGARQTRSGSSDKRMYPHVKILSDYSARSSSSSPPSMSPKLRQDAIYQSWMQDPAEISLGELVCEDEVGSVYEGRWRGGAVSVRVLRYRAGVDMTHDECRELLRDLVRPMRHPGLVLHMGSCRPSSEDGSLMLLREPLVGHQRLTSWIGSCDGSPLTVAKAAKDVLQALCFLHQASNPIVLGRLDPDRLVVDSDGHVKIPDVEVEVALKRRGLPLGPGGQGGAIYRAPEGASGMPPSNVYSTGVLCLAMLLRRTPTKNDLKKLCKLRTSLSSSSTRSSWFSSPRSKSEADSSPIFEGSPPSKPEGASFSGDALPEGVSLPNSRSQSTLASPRTSSSSSSFLSHSFTSTSSPREKCESVKSIVADMLAADPAARPTAMECMLRFENARRQLQKCSPSRRNTASCSVM